MAEFSRGNAEKARGEMTAAARLVNWWHDHALPFWLHHAWDPDNGGFLESLTMDGEPVLGDTRRVRVQARQIYVFARAHYHGWSDSLALAERGMSTLNERAHSPDGQPGWVHTLNPSGTVISPVRDLYDHAFLLLAASWLFRASGKREYLEMAHSIIGLIEMEMASEHGGFLESIGGSQAPRRQNPHMHLFEAMMALYGATNDKSVLDRVHGLKSLFDRVFYQTETRVLLEFFDTDWSPAKGERADVVEPGHLAEWIWLLAEYAHIERRDLNRSAMDLYESTLSHGVNENHGFLFASTRSDGRVIADGSRSWMQTEWIRAAAVMAARSVPGARDVFDRAISVLFAYHLEGAFAGGWMDAVDGAGQPASSVVPSSSLYHIMGAVIEAHYMEKGTRQDG